MFAGEGERFRRYARYVYDPARRTLGVSDHHRFFQAKKFDVLYGDLHRDFPPLTASLRRNAHLLALIGDGVRLLMRRPEPYEISVHMIRIQATPNSRRGRPAPEGIHRDGYEFGSIHLMKRENVSGARNGIYDLRKRLVSETTLVKPMDSIYFDDAAIFHGVSPFAVTDPARKATRDMLILLYQPLRESPQPAGLPISIVDRL